MSNTSKSIIVEARKPGHTQTGAPPKPGRSPNHHLTYTLVFFHV